MVAMTVEERDELHAAYRRANEKKLRDKLIPYEDAARYSRMPAADAIIAMVCKYGRKPATYPESVAICLKSIVCECSWGAIAEARENPHFAPKCWRCPSRSKCDSRVYCASRAVLSAKYM